ncbi:MAG TPA: YbaN family protein [Albitalea sp.]|nr:YbaN family protein [Albitalea sp.]
MIVWRLIAIVCILLGVIGIVLPVVPTVPFLLLAAGAASRGWPWLDERLTSHETYGPVILRWRERRAVPRAAKWYATAGMLLSAALLWLTPLPWWRLCVLLVMVPVGWWIWRRPEE